MKILYKLASRSRPERFFKVLDNIAINSRHDDYYILITLDIDDETMATDEVRERIARYPNTYPIYGTSKNKIDAINRDMEFAPDNWNILINMSDDMLFTEVGYDLKIINTFKEYFPIGDGFLHFHDGNIKQTNVCTMSIIDKKYYERDKKIYHDSYISLYCDQEETDKAKMRGRYWYMGDDLVIFKHLHNNYNPSLTDDLYIRNNNSSNEYSDFRNYQKRKALGFK